MVGVVVFLSGFVSCSAIFMQDTPRWTVIMTSALFTGGMVIFGVGVIIRLVDVLSNRKNISQQTGVNVLNQKNVVKRGPWPIINYSVFVFGALTLVLAFIIKSSDAIFFAALYTLAASILSILIHGMVEKRSHKPVEGEVVEKKK